MVRKTEKAGKGKKAGVFTIPELRRSFEYIETYVDEKIKKKESKEKIVRDLRKEWSRIFLKPLDKQSADSFVTDRLVKHPRLRHRTVRRSGGAHALAGAPLDYTTRAGMYLAPESIPTSAGHLPLSSGGVSNFGSYVQYVDKGFWNPEPGQSYDPVQGQPPWPHVQAGMGSNEVHFPPTTIKGGMRRTKKHGGNAPWPSPGSAPQAPGQPPFPVPFGGLGSNKFKGGNRKNTRKMRRGGSFTGALLSQAFTRPVPSSVPPSILQDAQSGWYGKTPGASPDQIQRTPDYLLGSVYPKQVSV